MLEFKNRGLRLEYEITGVGHPLVFLHGMGGSVRQIYSTYQPLPGVKLISMNQQGHGKSEVDWETLDFARMADDVAALLDYLHIEKVYLAGISMGAAVSLNFSVRYPERVEKLLLIRNAWTHLPMSEQVQTAYRDLGLALQCGGTDAFYETEGWKIIKETTDYTRNAFITPFSDASSIRNWRRYLILPCKAPIPSGDFLNRLTMPVTILANRNDFCHPFSYGAYFHTRIPGSKLVEIPDKDTDSEGHKRMINMVIKRQLFS